MRPFPPCFRQSHHIVPHSTARGAKVAKLQDRLAALGYGDEAEVVDVPDITHGTLPLDGVSAVIHTASPIPGSGSTAKQIVDVRTAFVSSFPRRSMLIWDLYHDRLR